MRLPQASIILSLAGFCRRGPSRSHTLRAPSVLRGTPTPLGTIPLCCSTKTTIEVTEMSKPKVAIIYYSL